MGTRMTNSEPSGRFHITSQLRSRCATNETHCCRRVPRYWASSRSSTFLAIPGCRDFPVPAATCFPRCHCSACLQSHYLLCWRYRGGHRYAPLAKRTPRAKGRHRLGEAIEVEGEEVTLAGCWYRRYGMRGKREGSGERATLLVGKQASRSSPLEHREVDQLLLLLLPTH